jgi:RNA polymerase sigma-70 factor (ECF subfamily)
VEASEADSTAQRLIARLVAGDSSALSQLYRQHASLVHGIARRVTTDADLAAEVTQEVFTHLWQHADRVDLDRGTIRAYLGVMAHRRAVDAVRHAERRRSSERRSEATGEATGDGVQDGPDVSVTDDAATAWRATLVRSLVERLPQEQRAAVELAYFRGMTYRDVAHALAIPEGTAKSRLRLGLAHLRSAWEAATIESRS